MTAPQQTIDFVKLNDREEIQQVVLAAALAGDAEALERLSAVQPGLDEPYRTAAAELTRLRQIGFVDAAVLENGLSGRRLVRRTSAGREAQLSAKELVLSLAGTPLAPGQAVAYLEILEQDLARRRREERRTACQRVVEQYADQPDELLRQLQTLTTEGGASADPAEPPCELLEVIPYIQQLEKSQQGTAFTGLDSGFEHLNYIWNGLEVGLNIVAAPPGLGKTTLVWQICCQAAALERVPVLFFSYEQSKGELRAKALARLAEVNYRHVLRGRLDAADPQQWTRLRNGLKQYLAVSPFVTIIEADDAVTVDRIRSTVAARMKAVGAVRALLGLDYLQVVPVGDRDAVRASSTKDRVDLHVSALRRLARDLGVSVLCISSENRAGYGSKNLDVFKETGGIEYGADIAAVLTHDKRSDTEGVRVLDLNVVKNRNGEMGVVRFKFYPQFARFVETERRELCPDDP